MPELGFFIGKGGVGKTTVSAAYAVRNALRQPRKRVLLLSTDPAHSLSDVLEMRLRSTPAAVRLPGPGRLSAWQIDAERLFRNFLHQHKQDILDIVESGSTIFSRADIEPLLDSALPGMAEMAALLAVNDAIRSRRYEHIVVDTAPFGHTLRLFAMPEHFLRFLDFLELASSRDRILAEHFGGSARQVGGQFLANWRKLVDELHRAFRSDATLFLVTTPEKFSLNESLRCAELLASYSPPMKIGAVVLNRALSGRQNCRYCRTKAEATRAALKFLRREFAGAELYVGEDPGCAIVGPRSLRPFAEHVFGGKPLNLSLLAPKSPAITLKRAAWPVLKTPLALVVGKGGVGKTTVSAALGFRTRSRTKSPVEICSVDPAPSLDDVFQQEIGDRAQAVLGDPGYRASEMDSVALFNQWVREIRDMVEESTTSEVSGIHVDLSFERQLLSALLDIVPPGVDEVLAVFRIVDLLGRGSQRVLIDMAPTGHALELLRMPERILAWTRPLLKTLAAHRTLAMAREAGVKIAELGQRVRELSALLKRREGARVYTVMLPESLPDRETHRLWKGLQNLGLPATSMFVNRVLFAAEVRRCQRCRRALEWQQATLASLKRRYPRTTIYVIRDFPQEIAGKAALRSFTGELWRLA